MPSPALLQHAGARALPPGILVDDVIDLSRQALVAFLRLDGGAERPELASWLFGPYLDALAVGRDPSRESTLALDQSVPGESVAALISEATHAIEHVLAAFHDDPDLSVAVDLVERNVVEPVIDERGGVGYAPLAGSAMPLAVRVLALVGAELLTRPDRLRADVVVGATSVRLADRPLASGIGLGARQTLPWTPVRDERSRELGWPSRAPTLAELVAAQDSPIADES